MSSASYPLTPDSVISRSKDYDILITDPAFGREKRRARGNGSGQPRSTFVLEHRLISFAQKETLMRFFEARRGKWDEFIFTDPMDSATYTVRFDQDILEAEKPIGREVYGRFNIRVSLREVL